MGRQYYFVHEALRPVISTSLALHADPAAAPDDTLYRRLAELRPPPDEGAEDAGRDVTRASGHGGK